MKKIIFLVSVFLPAILVSKQADAQYYFFDDTYYDQPVLYEAGASVNAMNCLTDLGGKKGVGKKFLKDLNTGYTHMSGGVFLSASYKNMFSLRLEGTFGKVSSRDEILEGVTDIAKERYNRNLDFQSNISEVSLMAEIYPTYIFIDWPAKETSPPRFAPYLLGGIGYFSFNPQTTLGNRKIDLQPLRTEGQGMAEYPDRQIYKLNQLCVPFGLGVKYELSPLLNVRGEAVLRKLFTDYLDDLSTEYIDPALFDKYLTPQQAINAKLLYNKQRQNHAGINGKRGTSYNNDAYFTLCIKLSVVIGRERMRR